MAEITLTAETGRTIGTRPSKRLRAEGKVPAVVYGHGQDPVSVTVEWRPLRAALTTDAGLNALIDLEIDGKKNLAIVKELQRHPIRQTVIHLDFLLISRDESLTVDVPIILTGEAEAVNREGGMVDHALFNLTITAKPADIPNEITVDISGLELGGSIRVGDLVLPNGVSTDVDPEEAVAIGQITRAAVEDEAEGEGGDAAEGGAASGGDAGSGGDASEGESEGGGGEG
ncbi:MAG TPA: 50S ribosomal protein L25 [Acidimicrobiales bacterium]